MSAHITRHSSVLLTRDVPASVAYWNDRLGFSTVGLYGEPVEFAILKRDDAHVMLGKAPADHVFVPNWKVRDGLWNAYFWVDDARAMFADLSARGARIDYQLGEKPYGVLEFGVQDLDGHDIAFGEVLNESKAN